MSDNNTVITTLNTFHGWGDNTELSADFIRFFLSNFNEVMYADGSLDITYISGEQLAQFIPDDAVMTYRFKPGHPYLLTWGDNDSEDGQWGYIIAHLNNLK